MGYELHAVLKTFWGYSSFRKPQEEIIESIISGDDVFALLPTGAGKSICYQVAGIVKGGLTLVITPLVALMQDQERILKERGISVVAIHGGVSKKDEDRLLDNCAYGNVKFLYVSPERLQSPLFKERFKRMPISLVAIDEAHCVSQWGYDFRPAYLNIKTFLDEECPKEVPLIALTATATEEVREDISEKIGLRNHKFYSTAFYRPNLAFRVLEVEDKMKEIEGFLPKDSSSSIVYAGTRREVKSLSNYLNKRGYESTYYHAGLSHEDKQERQRKWLSGDYKVIVATNAFGMGIDKPNVRNVVHANLPNNLEAYYQEAGRAGRDGKTAIASLMVQKKDLDLLKKAESELFPSHDAVKRVYNALCNHFNLAIESRPEGPLPLNLVEFRDKYRLPIPLILNSFKVLERNSVLTFNQSFYEPSTLFINRDKKDLYPYQLSSEKVDVLIKTLLRMYGGVLFSVETQVHELELSKQSRLPLKEVIEILQRLTDLELLRYKPSFDEPCVVFLQPRVNSKYLKIDRQAEGFLQKRYVAGVDSVRNYIELTNKCRSQFFAEYFGDESSPKCGVCDVCREEGDVDLGQFLSALNSDKLYSVQELSSIMSMNPAELGSLIREAGRQGFIEITHEGIKKA